MDLERREVVDVLPDRSTAGTANWLKQHPEVEIISRDRCGSFAQGAREGAPQARQVADRFPILQNLREAIQLQLSRASGSSVCPLLPETDGSEERDVIVSSAPGINIEAPSIATSHEWRTIGRGKGCRFRRRRPSVTG